MLHKLFNDHTFNLVHVHQFWNNFNILISIFIKDIGQNVIDNQDLFT